MNGRKVPATTCSLSVRPWESHCGGDCLRALTVDLVEGVVVASPVEIDSFRRDRLRQMVQRPATTAAISQKTPRGITVWRMWWLWALLLLSSTVGGPPCSARPSLKPQPICQNQIMVGVACVLTFASPVRMNGRVPESRDLSAASSDAVTRGICSAKRWALTPRTISQKSWVSIKSWAGGRALTCGASACGRARGGRTRTSAGSGPAGPAGPAPSWRSVWGAGGRRLRAPSRRCGWSTTALTTPCAFACGSPAVGAGSTPCQGLRRVVPGRH